MSKITIIIPTYNRHDYLRRIIDYYSSTDMQVVVVDSSSGKFEHKDNHIKYLYYKNHTYIEKMYNAMRLVKTKYAVLCADDDFIVPDAIKTCVDFLENNADYSSVQGHYSDFVNKKGKLIYSPCYVGGIGCDINSDEIPDRLQQFMATPVILFYAVHKTETLRDVFDIASHNIKNLNLIELLIMFVACIKGKHKVLPTFYGVREGMPSSLAVYTPTLDMVDTEEYNYFIVSLIQYLSSEKSIHITKAEQIILDAVQFELNTIKQRKSSKLVITLHKVDNIMPPLAKMLRWIYYSVQRRKEIALTKGIQGYPHSDLQARKRLDTIDYFVEKYDIRPISNPRGTR